MNLIISAIGQGILWGILSLGLFVSFRILNIADMTTEGAFPLGAAVCVTAVQTGMHPLCATLLAVLAGICAGSITGLLITVFKIPSLLAGILTMTALLSINLRIMGSPNLNLLNKPTIFSPFQLLHLPKYFDVILPSLLVVILIITALQFFFTTEIGMALIATGDNERMARSLGIHTHHMTIFGLMLSNGLVALAGAVIAQNNGYADINSGLGTIVVALAAIIIGEVIFSEVTFLQRLICIIYGSIIYRLLLLIVLRLEIIRAEDFKLVSALLIAICLVIPQIKKFFQGLQTTREVK